MAEHVIKMPDVGEGIAEAELVEWHVKAGDLVGEDTILAAVMTDKATVEIPSPVEGKVLWLNGEIGETIAVGSAIVKIEVAGGAETSVNASTDANVVQIAAEATPQDKTASAPATKAHAAPAQREQPTAANKPSPVRPTSYGIPRSEGERPVASPAVRLRAKEAGIDLRMVKGSGSAGRITHDDLDQFVAYGTQPVSGLHRNDAIEEIKVVGMRRRIAEKMAQAKSHIPHITYIDEVNVTALEELRARLNVERRKGRPKLTLLPFLMQAMVKAIADQPQMNAHFDDDAGIVRRYGGCHVGVAAQTDMGLVVPVVRHAEARDIWECANEMTRLVEAAKAGTATREDLTGSSITITSLGALGGLATTPIINYPEVAIVGVNKIAVRPVWDGMQFVPTKMMNLSSSFDHRVIDGWDAAVFVQRIKTLLENPAMIFMD